MGKNIIGRHGLGLALALSLSFGCVAGTGAVLVPVPSAQEREPASKVQPMITAVLYGFPSVVLQISTESGWYDKTASLRIHDSETPFSLLDDAGNALQFSSIGAIVPERLLKKGLTPPALAELLDSLITKLKASVEEDVVVARVRRDDGSSMVIVERFSKRGNRRYWLIHGEAQLVFATLNCVPAQAPRLRDVRTMLASVRLHDPKASPTAR